MKKPRASNRGKEVIESPIRKNQPLMDAARKKRRKVYRLNTGDPDLKFPYAFLQAIRAYKSRNLPYAPTPGYPKHVAAWLVYYLRFGVRLLLQNIIPTLGCAEAILLALMAVADPGDEILVFEPVYFCYKAMATMLGIKLIPVTLKIKNNFALPPRREIEKLITAKTKGIVVINPDNPTGKLWSDAELSVILRIAKKYGLFVIADETYREIRFKGKASSMLSQKGYDDYIIVVDSVSKRFSMPGARVGCLVSRNMEVMRIVNKFAQARLSVGTLEQIGLISLLKNSLRYTKPLRKEYKKRRDVAYRMLSAIPGVFCTKPEGAFYIYATLPIKSAEDFVRFLISEFSDNGETVMVSPMKDFYITEGLGLNEIRIAYVLEVPKLTRALELLRLGLEAYLARDRKLALAA